MFIPLALASIVAVPAVSSAANFTVSPTEANLSSEKASALVVLRNVAKTRLRFDISVFDWSESERGEMILKPTSDVTFFPKLVELPPGTARNIRIGLGAGAIGGTERSFRLFVEELPDESAPKPNIVDIRTKIGIPVFVRPAKPTRAAVIEGVTVEGGKVLTRVRNTGTLHVSVDGVTVHGVNATGGQTFAGDVKGWYVLSGATRIFELPVASAACAGTSSVAVEVNGHDKSLKGTGTVPPGACAAR